MSRLAPRASVPGLWPAAYRAASPWTSQPRVYQRVGAGTSWALSLGRRRTSARPLPGRRVRIR